MIIESLGVYLPPRAVTTAEVLRGCKVPIAFPFERMTGIRSRRMAGDGEYAIDLARKSVADCLARSKYGPADIDLIICCNISRVDGPNHHTTFEPSTSVRLRHDFGLTEAVAFDVSNACAGVFSGLAFAQGYLAAGAARRALVVSGEYISHLTRTAQLEIESFMDPRIACLTVGDAGVALLVESSPNSDVGFQALSLYTLGRYSSLCVAKPTDKPHGGAVMVTDSIKAAAVATAEGANHSLAMLRQNGWTLDSFRHILMHQTSETSLHGAAREINQRLQKKVCHEGNVVNNLAERGNTATTSHFVAIMDLVLANKLDAGDRVLFAVSGSGQITGGALYTFDDLPERIRRAKLGATTPRALPVPKAHTAARRPRVRIESIGTVPVDSAARGTVGLAKAASEACLAQSKHDRSDIDLLLFAGVYRDEFICEPAIAAMLAGAMQLNDTPEVAAKKKTFACDVFNGALGLFNACHLAVQMIQSGTARRTLVAASEVENNASIRPDHLVGLRETGSALILDAEGSGDAGFGEFLFRYATDHAGDLRSHYTCIDGKGCLQVEKSDDLQGHLLECIQGAVEELLQREGVERSAIKAVFAPQISADFLTDLATRLGIERQSFVDITAPGQDPFTSALPCAMRAALDGGMVKTGDIGLMICAGSGLQVGCTLYYF
jgi:3-oxoacyl-[acyl-carrier-protein] synthase III